MPMSRDDLYAMLAACPDEESRQEAALDAFVACVLSGGSVPVTDGPAVLGDGFGMALEGSAV